MTPRPYLSWIDINQPLDTICNKLRNCPYAQMLVCRDSIDDVVGIVRKQDLLDQSLDRGQLDIERAVRPPHVIPEGSSILRALELFRANLVNEALVVDEFQGIVTPADLLEAVADDLAKVEGETGPRMTRRDDGSFIIDAAVPMDEVTRLLRPTSLPPGDFVTLAGFALSQLSRLPQRAESISSGANGIFRLRRWTADESGACSCSAIHEIRGLKMKARFAADSADRVNSNTRVLQRNDLVMRHGS